ncbi:MAG TPA: PilZ domain-containing protein [Oligoflexus sp.]|uniref:PilZ domain-containing protein n=1 Tax=Oligoflexus sp. TaxID=1971216 RepID=UPI002D7F0FC2|nr:PilZ domain-containing protein [Oligoflexus sp.]HET9237571.1 PilZ domain-containing protein [Oligoflexus sp.]
MTEKLEKPSRNYFRLEYPKEARPQIAIGNGKFPVINLSEKGVKFSFDAKRSAFVLDTENPLDATIIFQDHGRTQVTGRILRIDSDAVVLELTEGVPLQRIMTEQRVLLNKFGNLKRPFEG